MESYNTTEITRFILGCLVGYIIFIILVLSGLLGRFIDWIFGFKHYGPPGWK